MPDTLQVRTVRLEFLRPGPSHNQLLSPLTAYLAVCGDSPAGVVHVPYEHAVFERRLADLRYTGGSDTRLAQLRDTGVDMGRMLASVPGLPGSVSADADSPTMIHLRITLSASELALLPFELSKVPVTVDGESEAWLALQTRPPVCITRHVRTVSAEQVTWPSRPRILFITGPVVDLPVAAHRRALEQAIAPYRYPRRDDPAEGVDARHTHYGDLLTIIEDASLDDVVTACRETSFTHVHVLAHGAVDFSSKGRPFGIRLRGRTGGIDIVSGERFSTALARVDNARVHQPFVVTLASCDTGLVAGVVEPAPGASFIHALHGSGIPLVVGSQFPLTRDGSVTVVELFYRGLLRGDNPHLLAHQTRAELHARYGAETHDWASLVIYEALPSSMDAQLERVCYTQGRRQLDAALERVDLAVQDAIEHGRLTRSFDELEADVRRAIAALPGDGAYAIECLGLRASAMKRLAQATFVYGTAAGQADVHFGLCCDRLEDALAGYRAASETFLRHDVRAVQRAATLHWVLVQQLAMEAVLRQRISPALLAVASHTAALYLDHPDVEERGWAHASLAELALLRLTGTSADADVARCRDGARHHTSQLVATAEGRRFLLASTERQFRRYVDWWGADGFERFAEKRAGAARQSAGWADTGGVVGLANELASVLAAAAPAVERERPRVRRTGQTPAAPAGTPAPHLAGEAPARRRRRTAPHEGAFVDIRMLPAQWGDCLWIEYGTDPRQTSRVLVDCGTRGTAARLLAHIESLPSEDRGVELFILTHVDDDHIGGAIPLLEAELGGLDVEDVWFNGYGHLTDLLGAEQGERFSALILTQELPWNAWRDRQPIVVDSDTLPTHTLPGGMHLTLLSPTPDKLDSLKVVWERELRNKGIQPGAGLDPGTFLAADEREDTADEHDESTDVEELARTPFKSDTAAANGSSIAVLAEFEGKSVILAADAHPAVLESAIKKIIAARGGDRLRVDALKVSHHGSHGNTSPELLALLDCRRFLISTNGQKFSHPHRPTIARLIQAGGPGAQLFFNYSVPEKNGVWARPDLQERYRYGATYPETTHGLTVKL